MTTKKLSNIEEGSFASEAMDSTRSSKSGVVSQVHRRDQSLGKAKDEEPIGTPELKKRNESVLSTLSSSTNNSPRYAKSTATEFQDTFQMYLFRFCPDLKAKFPKNFRLIVAMIKSFVEKVIKGQAEEAYAAFAKTHIKYNLTKDHFNGFAESIVKTVVTRMGEMGNINIAKIWREETTAAVELFHSAYSKRQSKLLIT